MEALVTAIVTILAAIIGFWAAMKAASNQITALQKSSSEQIEYVLRQLGGSIVDMQNKEVTAIDDLLIQYPRYRACFDDGIEPEEIEGLTDEDKQRVKAIAARLVNGYANILLRPLRMKFDNAWGKAFVAIRYGKSPACCDHLISHIAEYTTTGELQIQLMLKGLEGALELAKSRNDPKRVERLTGRIAAAEKSRGLFAKSPS